MSYIINLLEAFIVSYGLVELCNIDKKKLFFVLNTVITFLMINYFDCINQNFTVSMLIFGLLWYVLVCIFAQENYIYNLFIAIFINLLCDLSAVIPVLFIYKYSVVFAGLTAKLIQFIMTYLFVKFRRKYYYFEDKYWFTIITVMVLGELIIIFQDEQIISNVYTTTNVLINIFIVIIMGISLYFFQLIEESNLEKERITKLYEKQKYQDLTYTFMKSAKDELDRFEHRMIYKIRNVKLEIEKHDYDEAIKLIENYRDEIHRINRTVYTGNGVFDTSMMLKLKELEYDVTPCFTISSRKFYNNVQFMNLILELLDAIHVKSLSLIIKEEKNICIVQCVGKDLSLCFDEIKHIFDKKIDFAYKYQMQENDSIDLFTLKIRMEDE
ncbi:hypothetical protein LIX92_07455 [Faecalibacillus faecis]|jgi:hypothetical protein|uniref:hypothetical protein n=1 Tax=Faecalibacillus faecis TaxID=1982628 RepID=UPI001D06EDCA|nr:hypothetical protein [Faecalibacillus faecis]MCB7489291.1 hypothetical protein [Faecalibacillus faecis]MCG4593051.1 hypothetical protein [Faecalibacillus faecis]